jgi:hypothetical protein
MGNSATTFSGCVFVQWDHDNVGEPAIKALQGSLIVTVRENNVVPEPLKKKCVGGSSILSSGIVFYMQGNTFEEAKKQIDLSAGVSKAIITSNIFAGPQNITNNAKQAAIDLNLFG